jgi:hypothetical protein
VEGLTRTLAGAWLGGIGILFVYSIDTVVGSLIGRQTRVPLDVAFIGGVIVGSIAIWKPRRGG